MSDDKKKKTNEEKAKALENAGLAGAASEVVQRYGSANQQFLVAYDGVNYETGTVLSKSLKEESARYHAEVKSDPSQQYKALKTHAGNAAEVSEVAIENAKRIINKDPTRRITTDDLDKAKGGQRNHPLYDHVDIDKNGNPISGTESQMKMRGDNAQEAHDKLMEKGKLRKDGTYKNEKYLDKDVKLKVQKGYADDIREIAQEKIKDLEKQKKALTGKQGKEEELRNIQRQIDKETKIAKNVEDSNVSNQASKDLVRMPEPTITKDILKTSHQAGIEAAKNGAVIAGGMSLIRNIVDVAKGNKEPDEAALAVVKDTAGGAAVSYGTAFAGSVISGLAKNDGRIYIENGIKILKPDVLTQTLGKTNLPGQIVIATIEAGKTLGKYFKGEIDGVECLTELGEKGTALVSSAMFTTLGQIAIPIPVVGGLIGSMVGYALSSACYGQLVSVLQEAKFAHEERIRIEAECKEAIKMIRRYRAELEVLASNYLSDHIITFQQSFDSIKTALQLGDIDGVIAGTNMISIELGKPPQFRNMEEFEDFMRDKETALKL
jgi:hypothetical protein